MNDKPLFCPKCNKEPRVVISMVGSYVRCPWCDFSTWMQNTREDAIRLWNKLVKEIEMKDNIVNISMKEIYPHPDNPRKDLGDLTELSKSIKANGIMQNLTVIPGHKMTDEEWLELERKYKENPSEELRNTINTRWLDIGYTLIIGHRRHAAAKAAGLTELPCRIVKGLSYREQVAIMLEENMQRNDLTILEQAQGFQMMLDLGETEDSIAEKTGFSKTTIKRRLNIAKLDQKLVREKEQSDSFQLSLTDLYALEKIEDVETRNKVLSDASNHEQLVWKVNRAVQEAKEKKIEEAIVAKLKELGVKKATKKMENEIYTSKWSIVKEFSLSKEIPENISLKGKELYWMRRYGSIAVIKENKKQAKQQTEYELKRKQLEANRKKVNTKAKEAAVQMKEFVRAFATNKLSPKEQTWHKEALWEMLKDNGSYVGTNKLVAYLLDKEQYSVTEKDRQETEETICKMKMYQQMLCMLVYSLNTELADYNGYYNLNKGKRLMTIYDFLIEFGFDLDEEYISIMDGSSELYAAKEEVKNEQ